MRSLVLRSIAMLLTPCFIGDPVTAVSFHEVLLTSQNTELTLKVSRSPLTSEALAGRMLFVQKIIGDLLALRKNTDDAIRLEMPFTILEEKPLAYQSYGPADGVPILYLAGLGATALIPIVPDMDTLLFEIGVRLIGIERPGIGESPRVPGRTARDLAKAIQHLVDHIIPEQSFALLGYSGGGRFAQECADLRRLFALGLVSPTPPINSKTAWLLNPMNMAKLWLARSSHTYLFQKLQKKRDEKFEEYTAALETNAGDRFSGKERIVFQQQDTQKIVFKNRLLGLSNLPGVADDYAAAYRRPQFPLKEIPVPVWLWHGKRDKTAPWLVSWMISLQVPKITTFFLAGEGHHFMKDQTYLKTILERIKNSSSSLPIISKNKSEEAA